MQPHASATLCHAVSHAAPCCASLHSQLIVALLCKQLHTKVQRQRKHLLCAGACRGRLARRAPCARAWHPRLPSAGGAEAEMCHPWQAISRAQAAHLRMMPLACTASSAARPALLPCPPQAAPPAIPQGRGGDRAVADRAEQHFIDTSSSARLTQQCEATCPDSGRSSPGSAPRAPRRPTAAPGQGRLPPAPVGVPAASPHWLP